VYCEWHIEIQIYTHTSERDVGEVHTANEGTVSRTRFLTASAIGRKWGNHRIVLHAPASQQHASLCHLQVHVRGEVECTGEKHALLGVGKRRRRERLRERSRERSREREVKRSREKRRLPKRHKGEREREIVHERVRLYSHDHEWRTHELDTS
jgi:hypothetical protein